jgi:hypothetical protein
VLDKPAGHWLLRYSPPNSLYFIGRERCAGASISVQQVSMCASEGQAHTLTLGDVKLCPECDLFVQLDHVVYHRVVQEPF